MSYLRLLNIPVLLGALLTLGVAGCAVVTRHPDIPANATMTNEGAGRLAYTAPEDGKVYVYDVSEDQLVYSGHVAQGEMVVADPEEDRIAVDQRTVSEQPLAEGSVHRLFFTPEGQIEENPPEQRRTREEI